MQYAVPDLDSFQTPRNVRKTNPEYRNILRNNEIIIFIYLAVPLE